MGERILSYDDFLCAKKVPADGDELHFIDSHGFARSQNSGGVYEMSSERTEIINDLMQTVNQELAHFHSTSANYCNICVDVKGRAWFYVLVHHRIIDGFRISCTRAPDYDESAPREHNSHKRTSAGQIAYAYVCKSAA